MKNKENFKNGKQKIMDHSKSESKPYIVCTLKKFFILKISSTKFSEKIVFRHKKLIPITVPTKAMPLCSNNVCYC